MKSVFCKVCGVQRELIGRRCSTCGTELMKAHPIYRLLGNPWVQVLPALLVAVGYLITTPVAWEESLEGTPAHGILMVTLVFVALYGALSSHFASRRGQAPEELVDQEVQRLAFIPIRAAFLLFVYFMVIKEIWGLQWFIDLFR